MNTPPSNPNGEAFGCKLPHQLHNTKSIDGSSSKSIDTQPLPSDYTTNAKLDHYAIACGRIVEFNYIYQIEASKLIDGDTSASIDDIPPELREEKDKYGVYRDMHGRPRNLQGHVISISSSHIRDILQRASLREPSFICLPEHRERFTTPIPSDPVAYSREEVDKKLNEIYTIQYDSMNDFKCKLDSVYHPLNDKITGLTKTLKQLTLSWSARTKKLQQGFLCLQHRPPTYG
ncbi:hypothetical protein Rs2_43947 [Raphanus sativus]|nr:hypothetical protein Rs2_43947 [Raphanus sativus]